MTNADTATVQEPAAEPLVEVPTTTDGLPAWTRMGIRQVNIGGLAKNIGDVQGLDQGQADQVKAAIQKFLGTRRIMTYTGERAFKTNPKTGRRSPSNVRHERRAVLEDVLGATLHLASASGRTYGPPEIHITLTLKTGDNFEVTLDGDPRHICAFCGGHQTQMVEDRLRGLEYHENCKRAATVEVAREERSITEKVFGKAKFTE